MTVDQRQRVRELFEQATALPRDDRESFLARACGDDDATRAEVESLLEHDERVPAEFMHVPEPATSESDESNDAPDPLLGKRISRYEIKSVIATGGMGTVYEAEQDNPKRIVALKVMRAGVASRFALRHFERESQILARLRHTHIAQVYEAGTFKGAATGHPAVPFFAMEYIPNALPITAYADQQGLSTRERLELFGQVCDAVHHGHQKGIIHRDLKPGNILVGEDGLVKVIDFGVARSTDSDVAVTTMRTDVGQLVGTLQYMSPEQCDADPLGLDTRSDVYSLGVVLYKLLCRDLPYDVSHSSIHVAARVICEQQPVPPSAVDRRLRGDLEAIVLKALEKDRERRYESAAALGDDIRRHLKREPIAARVPGPLLRLSRAVTRHPILATTAACILIAATSLAVAEGMVRNYYLKPVAVQVSEDRQTVSLISRARAVIHTWPTQGGRAILSSRFVKRRSAPGSIDLALIGYDANLTNKYHGAIVAYDVRRDLEKPVWHQSVAEDQIPTFLLNKSGKSPKDCGVRRFEVLDVFPELPGDEIVAVYHVLPTTQTAIRVFNLDDGALLYQSWMDVSVAGFYWMSDPGLLVIAGNNGSAYWEDRGFPDIKHAHPLVVFAVRLEHGLITTDYLQETTGKGALDPVWYRCLLPPEASNWELSCRLQAPDSGYHPASNVIFSVGPSSDITVSWHIDRNGNIVPSDLHDAQKRWPDKYADLRQLYLGDLPPVVDRGEGGGSSELPGDGEEP